MEERKDFIKDLKRSVQLEGETDEEFIERMRRDAEKEVVQKLGESYNAFWNRRYEAGLKAVQDAEFIIEMRERDDSSHKDNNEFIKGRNI